MQLHDVPLEILHVLEEWAADSAHPDHAHPDLDLAARGASVVEPLAALVRLEFPRVAAEVVTGRPNAPGAPREGERARARPPRQRRIPQAAPGLGQLAAPGVRTDLRVERVRPSTILTEVSQHAAPWSSAPAGAGAWAG